MLKSCLRAAAGALFAAGVAGSAQAATIVVTPTLAPNGFGSPSYAAWVNNTNNALLQGLTANGTPNTPSYFQAESNIHLNDLAVTSFNSWRGFADPGSVFGAAYANELGTRGHFAVLIDGDGEQIRISDLSFVGATNDVGNTLGFSFATGSFSYNSNYWGVLFGGDGVLGGGDDTIITGGANTQLVDMIVGRGAGNAYWPTCAGCTVEQQQAAINDQLLAWEEFPTQFTGTYTLGSDTGTGTFNISAPVPEPSTWMLMIAGFGAMGAAMRRRRADGRKAFMAA